MTSCADCPDFNPADMPPGWVPRASCCRDDHIARRLRGSPEPWEGVDVARAASDSALVRKNRAQRRLEARKEKRK